MRIKLFILILFCSFQIYGQKTAYEQKYPYACITLINDTSISFTAKNSKIDYKEDIQVFYKGTPTAFYDFFLNITSFVLMAYPGNNEIIDGHVICKLENLLTIWSTDGKSYYKTDLNHWKILKEKFGNYCVKNKISYR